MNLTIASVLVVTCLLPISIASAHEGEHGTVKQRNQTIIPRGKTVIGTKLTLKLSGLHCAGCADTVRNQLQKIRGVASVTVNTETQSAVVILAPGAKRPSDTVWKAAVKSAGYTCIAVKG